MGFEVPGFLTDLAKSAVVGVAQGVTNKLAPKPPTPTPAARPVAKPSGMSTGAKIAIGFGGLLAVGLVLKAMKKG